MKILPPHHVVFVTIVLNQFTYLCFILKDDKKGVTKNVTLNIRNRFLAIKALVCIIALYLLRNLKFG